MLELSHRIPVNEATNADWWQLCCLGQLNCHRSLTWRTTLREVLKETKYSLLLVYAVVSFLRRLSAFWNSEKIISCLCKMELIGFQGRRVILSSVSSTHTASGAFKMSAWGTSRSGVPCGSPELVPIADVRTPFSDLKWTQREGKTHPRSHSQKGVRLVLRWKAAGWNGCLN